MLSSVNYVKAWNRENIGVGVSSKVGVVLPKRNTTGGGTSLGGGKRDFMQSIFMVKGGRERNVSGRKADKDISTNTCRAEHNIGAKSDPKPPLFAKQQR